MAREPELILHVGLPKTGTSTIQRMISTNGDALRKQGVTDLGPIVFRQLKPFLLLKNPETKGETIVDAVFNQVHASSGRYLLSCEYLVGDVGNHIAPLDQILDWLSPRLEGINVTIIVYLRRQDAFVESMYMQHVKSGSGESFDQYLATNDHEKLNWSNLLHKFANRFGKQNVRIGIYGGRGMENDIVEDFSEKTGLRFAASEGNMSLNPGYSVTGLRLARGCNPILSPGARRYLRQVLQKKAPKRPFEKMHLFGEIQRAQFLSAFSKSNAQIAMEFFGRQDGKLFDGPSLDAHPVTEDLDLKQIVELVAYLAEKSNPSVRNIVRMTGRQALDSYAQIIRPIANLVHRIEYRLRRSK